MPGILVAALGTFVTPALAGTVVFSDNFETSLPSGGGAYNTAPPNWTSLTALWISCTAPAAPTARRSRMRVSYEGPTLLSRGANLWGIQPNAISVSLLASVK